MASPEAITGAAPPWEQPGAVRRDCEPHRGQLVLKLADAGLLLGALALCVGFVALLALALGAAAWVLASREETSHDPSFLTLRSWARRRQARDGLGRRRQRQAVTNLPVGRSSGLPPSPTRG
jgi:hypothetical protein